MVNFANASVIVAVYNRWTPYKKVVDELPALNLGPALL
jgi:hypothetical protein